MESVKLMNRIDTKFAVPLSMLPAILDAAQKDYYAQEIDGKRIATYDTMYYDTESLDMYVRHHDKQLVRQKIRVRQYVESQLTFLEIKRKNNKGRTKKKRIGIPVDEMEDFSSDKKATSYLAEHSVFTIDQLSPVLSTAFDRITLVNTAKTERITIDTNLYFNNFRTGRKASLQDAVIIEIKQDGRTKSQMKGILLDNRVKPIKVSKYCVAVTLTDNKVKSGRFKEKVRTIEKVINKRIQVI